MSNKIDGIKDIRFKLHMYPKDNICKNYPKSKKLTQTLLKIKIKIAIFLKNNYKQHLVFPTKEYPDLQLIHEFALEHYSQFSMHGRHLGSE
jgi:hypothetical protein